MDKTRPPESFGAFKPVNHVVIAFPSEEALEAALQDLRRAGVEAEQVVRYRPEEMMAQADRELHEASPVAAVGQELNLVRAHRELAQAGHHFLVVPAKGSQEVERAARIARERGATRAQRYGRMIIEELIEVGEGLPQVAESPARGLDAQTRSGEERTPSPSSVPRR